jgi:hypothetical protein
VLSLIARGAASGPCVFLSVVVVGAAPAARRVSGSGNYLGRRRAARGRTVSVRVWPSGLSLVVVQRGVHPYCTQLTVYGNLTWAPCIALLHTLAPYESNTSRDICK